MAVHRWRDVRAKKLSPEALEQIDGEVKAELEPATERVLLRLTKSEVAGVKAAAAAEDRTVGGWIRGAIRERLKDAPAGRSAPTPTGSRPRTRRR